MGFFSSLGDIAGGLIGGVAGGFFGQPELGASIGSSLLGSFGSSEDTSRAVDSANSAASAAAQANRDFQQYNSDTAIRRRVTDLQAAGLNPMLAYQQGGAAVPGGSVAATTDANTMLNSGFTQARVNNETSLLQSQLANVNADTDVKSAQADNIRTDMALKNSQISLNSVTSSKMSNEIDNIRQQILESNQRISTLYSQGKLSDSQASYYRSLVPGIILQRNLTEAQTKFYNTSAFSNVVGAQNKGQDYYMSSLNIPLLENISNAQSSTWMKEVHPYLSDILSVSNSMSSAGKSFQYFK